MPLQRISCPECGAGLKSSTGFKPGQSVTCPKCESYFTVEEPEEDEDRKPARAASDEDEDDRPRKKKKKRRVEEDDEPRSYKNSPIRYVILAVLVIVMLVLGYMLYEKRKREAASLDIRKSSPHPGRQETSHLPHAKL